MRLAAIRRAGDQHANIVLFVVDHRVQFGAVAQCEDDTAMSDEELLTLRRRHVPDAGNLKPDQSLRLPQDALFERSRHDRPPQFSQLPSPACGRGAGGEGIRK